MVAARPKHKKVSPKSNKTGIELGPQRDDEIRETIQPQKSPCSATDDFDTIFARVNFKRGDYGREWRRYHAANTQHSSKMKPQIIEKRVTTTKESISHSAARAGETQISVENRYTSAAI